MSPNPTPYPELNGVLRELTERAQAILGDNFVGAYLQGSFAVGDADMNSDCDFLIPVRGPITPAQETALRDMHREFPARPQHWAQHLEGSYPPVDELRTLDALGKPWLYIDHGLSEMEWSTHCNSEVVRWSLRECGVTLAGPDPKSLVDEVPADVLRAKMRELIPRLLPDMTAWISMDISWAQRYAVATFCRMLHTLESGRVSSKRSAMLWGRDHLDPQWSSLIQRAIDGRTLQWDAPADPDDLAATYKFAAYAEACGAG
jgi:hypothetical protein